MDIRPIRTEADYIAALAEVSRLMDTDPPEGSVEFDRMDVLATLTEAYEARVHPIENPHPIEAIEVRMAEKGMTRNALCGVTGISVSKMSEILACKRALSLNMIRHLGPALGLPIELLVQSYPIEQRPSGIRKEGRRVAMHHRQIRESA